MIAKEILDFRTQTLLGQLAAAPLWNEDLDGEGPAGQDATGGVTREFQEAREAEAEDWIKEARAILDGSVPARFEWEAKRLGEALKAVTLRATLRRIQRKAEIMALDAHRASPVKMDADEIRQLADIGLRALGGDDG